MEKENKSAFLEIPIEILGNKRIRPTEILIFGLVKLFSNDKKDCFIGNTHLSQLTGVSEATVSMSIKRLVEENYLSIVSFDGRTRKIAINYNYKHTHKSYLEKFNNKWKDMYVIYQKRLNNNWTKFNTENLQERKEGFVYFLHAPRNKVKIGRTKDKENRIRNLEMAIPYDTHLLKIIKVMDSYKVESMFHEQYKDKRDQGEWFIMTDEDINDIQQDKFCSRIKDYIIQEDIKGDRENKL